jgi:NTP pyrophosphatase (non-canonical NTP hydrolase)
MSHRRSTTNASSHAERIPGFAVRSHGVDLVELQDVIERTYGALDRARGVPGTVAWLCEETGELAQALRKGTRAELEHEFSDVLAWVATLANLVDVDLASVAERYRDGCPKCHHLPCTC